jgi:hypothetical protein
MANKNYPHPVLGPYRDDYDPSMAEFDIRISKKINRINYQLVCEVDLKEHNLEKLLQEGKVNFVVKVVCSTTRYRQVFQFNEFDHHQITIPSSLLEKKVEISTYITALERIENFSSPFFNDIYEDVKFTVFPGDVLAEGSEYKFNVDKQIDSLVKVPSIFTIVYSDNNLAAPSDIRYTDEKIVVTLNKKNFEKYKNLKEMQNQYGYLAPLTSALFILPGLVTVIENLLKELKDLEDDKDAVYEYIEEKEIEHKWFKVINARLLDLGIKLTDPDDITDSSLIIAQKLLGDPLSNGLDFFSEFLVTSGED